MPGGSGPSAGSRCQPDETPGLVSCERPVDIPTDRNQNLGHPGPSAQERLYPLASIDHPEGDPDLVDISREGRYDRTMLGLYPRKTARSVAVGVCAVVLAFACGNNGGGGGSTAEAPADQQMLRLNDGTEPNSEDPTQ